MPDKIIKQEEQIELVNPIKKLEPEYRKWVSIYIEKGLISLEEWNKRFKHFRDDCGYSMIHYLQAVINNLDLFVTDNPIMIEERDELMKRFKVKIITLEEFMKEKK